MESQQITSRDIVVVHGISTNSKKVLCKFLNQKDAAALLNSYLAIRHLNVDTIGISTIDKIYRNEHLSAFSGNLAHQCRSMYKADLTLNTKVVKGVV